MLQPSVVPADLQALPAQIGYSPNQQVVAIADPETVIRDVRCQTRHRAGLTGIIGKHHGDHIGAYDGVWPDWSSNPELPLECP